MPPDPILNLIFIRLHELIYTWLINNVINRRHLIKCLLISILLGFCFSELVLFFPSLKPFFGAVKKPGALCFCFVGLWLRVGVGVGDGETACPPLLASSGPSGGARLCGRCRLGMVGCGSHPVEGRSAFLAHQGSSARAVPSLSKSQEKAAESSPIGEPFISLFLQ